MQTDNTAGNQVVAYDRVRGGYADARRRLRHRRAGWGPPGSVVDHLASQGSLAYDHGNSAVYAVNAGSNTISVFSVHG